MYGVVLLVAMSSGGETPDFFRSGCHGCSGYSGCCGSSCYGGGCCGAVISSGCYGGGCSGAVISSGCHGCMGSSWSGCHGGGGCSGVISSGCHGCHGSSASGCHGGGGHVTCHGCGYAMTPGTPTMGYASIMPVSNTATIVVNLPAEAKLIIGSQATTSTSQRRVFTSPELTPGKSYEYVLKAEIVRNGQPVSWEEKVIVEAGKSAEVTLTAPATGLASR